MRAPNTYFSITPGNPSTYTPLGVSIKKNGQAKYSTFSHYLPLRKIELSLLIDITNFIGITTLVT